MSSVTALKIPSQESCVHYSHLPVQFKITAEIDPSALLRILENFALRNLVPDQLRSTTIGNQLVISVTVSGLSDQEVRHLTLRMQNILPVRSVEIGQS
jgi:acetolactate synthase regulatory subunit